MGSRSHPPTPLSGSLANWWGKSVESLVTLPDPGLSPQVAERHRIYSLLLMAMVADYWNGNKRGKDGSYNFRDKQKHENGQYRGGDYLGHNIACLAVDGRGEIIDFDFNHNDIFQSSAEHAEARLVRRLFSLTQIHDDWATRSVEDPPKSVGYQNLLTQVTVYTSLESCSQCSGIMALGSVKEVVFLQRDPGQSSIGNILRNLTPPGQRYMPPLPIPASYLGLGYFDELSAGFQQFEKDVQTTPFYISPENKPDHGPAITSFLCTDVAQGIFQRGADELQTLKLEHGDCGSPVSDNKSPRPGLTNAEALAHARRFRDYVRLCGRRGTPHK